MANLAAKGGRSRLGRWARPVCLSGGSRSRKRQTGRD